MLYYVQQIPFRLPHVTVEAAASHVPQDLDLGVEVALPHDAPFPLGNIRGPPRRIEVM
jgi:hypothetical protein